MKKLKNSRIKLDPEEEALLHSFEQGEWKTAKNVIKEKSLARQTARNTLAKNVRINIRLSSTDVSNIKQIAAFEGLPYQTLIASILHKFAAGHRLQ